MGLLLLLLKMGPEVPSRARRALPALRRSENEDGRRPSECSRGSNFDFCMTYFRLKCQLPLHFSVEGMWKEEIYMAGSILNSGKVPQQGPKGPSSSPQQRERGWPH